MTHRVVSKRTKLLFIGFGAAAIAAACIVSTAPGLETAGRPNQGAAVTAKPAK